MRMTYTKDIARTRGYLQRSFFSISLVVPVYKLTFAAARLLERCPVGAKVVAEKVPWAKIIFWEEADAFDSIAIDALGNVTLIFHAPVAVSVTSEERIMCC